MNVSVIAPAQDAAQTLARTLSSLESLKDDRASDLDPCIVAQSIFQAAPLAAGRMGSDWAELWPDLESRIDELLIALEAQSAACGLARRTRIALERLVIQHASRSRPLTVGHTHAIQVEVTQPVPDLALPAPVERLQCDLELEGTHLGSLELPVCDGYAPGYVIADAIAAEYAWPILGRFLAHTVYRNLRVERRPSGLSLWRGTLCLADGLAGDEDALWPGAHDQVGWLVFLQELWARPNWPNAYFYDPEAVSETVGRCRADSGWLVVEAGENLSEVEAPGQTLHVVMTVGGVAVETVSVPIKGGRVQAHALRTTLVAAGGMELCRAAVREALIGRPLTGGMSLRARLAAAKAQQRKCALPLPAPMNVVATPGSTCAANLALSGSRGLALGRRAHAPAGTSVSRRAALPVGAAAELIEAAEASGEPVIQFTGPGEQPKRMIYAPDLISRSPDSERVPGARGNRSPPQRRRELPVSSIATRRLPILMYHRVAPGGSPASARYRVTPEAFEMQLSYLRRAGFYSVRLDDWRAAMEARRPLPGRAIHITFDDGYRDFTAAWSLLKRYGFSATVLLVADKIGRSYDWDAPCGEEIPLLDWDEIHRLQEQGVEFGSHSASHPYLTALSHEELVRECVRSRMILERGLGAPVLALAYPYGDVDPVVQHLAGACGYVYGLTCESHLSDFQDSLLALPRLEVLGSDDMTRFAAKLGV
jgi:peptidoglycan/xylan/chitin deacetylase (PgdA/CDA1 family)